MQELSVRPSSGQPYRTAEAVAACRFCAAPLARTFVHLGMSPLCQSVLEPLDLQKVEEFWPLHVLICESCLLVQLQACVSRERLFSEYAYFSSYSDTLLLHAQAYVDAMMARLRLGPHNQVVEVASNDGYLLQYFVNKSVPVLGIDPAANVARVAEEKGVSTVIRFLGVDTAIDLSNNGTKADLLLGNNVLPHVPDLHDFVGGLKILLSTNGTITMEFQHLMRIVEGNQFDTIYQEHFSYLSLTLVEKLFAQHGLSIYDVEEISMHGGSLRIYACHAGIEQRRESVAQIIAQEDCVGMNSLEYYTSFGERVKKKKRELLEFLIRAKEAGKTIVGYGAAGKTNTLFNYCGMRTDFIDYTVDRNPYKQGRFLPGTHIPVHSPDRIRKTRPDYVFIGPWNLAAEIIGQTAYIREWGGKWIIPIPAVKVVD